MSTYLNQFTRLVSDQEASHTMLTRRNKLIEVLMGAKTRNPSRPNTGSSIVKNFLDDAKDTQVTISGDTPYDTTVENNIHQAKYQFARMQHSYYINGFDFELNTGMKLDELASNMEMLPQGKATTLVNVNREQLIESYAEFWRRLNRAFFTGRDVTPVSGRTAATGYATKILGLSDFATAGGTFAGIKRTDVANIDVSTVVGSNQSGWQPQWNQLADNTGSAPNNQTVYIFDNGTRSNQSLAKLFTGLNYGASQLSAAQQMRSQFHAFWSQNTKNQVAAELIASVRLPTTPSQSANPDIGQWDESFYWKEFNCNFHVDSDCPDNAIYAFNEACLTLETQSSARMMSAADILGKWRYQQDRDMLLLPMSKMVQLASDNLSQIGGFGNIANIRLLANES